MATYAESPEPKLDRHEPEIDLKLAVAVLRRRFWVLVSVAAAVVLAGVLLTLRAPRIYKASAVLMIEQTAPEVLGNVREVYDLGAPSYWQSKEYYQTQYAVMRSQPVAQRAAASLGLAPRVLAEELRALGPESLEARVAADPLHGAPTELRERLALLGLAGRARRSHMIDELEALDAAKYVRDKILIEPVKDSRLVAIAVEDTDPKRAARFANAVADVYIEYNLDQKVLATRSAADWLSDQLHELKEKLQASELLLYEFKRANNIVSVSMENRQTMISETLSQLNRSLSETRARRIALESRREQLRRLRASGPSREALEEVIENELIQQLKASFAALKQQEAELALKYTASHPKLIAVRESLGLLQAGLDAEVEKIVISLDKQYETALDTERRLEIEIDRVKGEALELNKREIEYNRLRRERDNNQALYDLVLKREKEADLTQLLKVNNVRKLEAATAPSSPIRPRVKLNLLVAVLLGLVLGLAAAFGVDYFDNSVKSQRQVEHLLGLPFLGILPIIKGEKAARLADPVERDQYILTAPRSSVAECCRAVRTNLLFMSHERPARRILITSSGPQEGKSTTAINLAITMAQAGARTVLLDTDMRRPRLHKSFGLDSDAGISSLIMGEIGLAEALRPSGIERLDVITCGPLPPNPAELLHTESFQRILNELTQRYERIFLDSPPVGAVTDALVLASTVDGTVLVVQAGKTSWQAALQARRRVESIGGALFGVVLNGVDLDDKRSGEYYRYYQYYRAGYNDAPTKAVG